MLTRRLRRIILMMGWALLLSGPLRANDTQRLIVDAGVNLGLWATQVELFNTPANEPAMINYATNAFNAITAVQQRLRPPFQNIDLQPILNDISRYPTYTAQWNVNQRANYVTNIYRHFRSRISVLFLSTRGIYASPNCDSAFLDVGYFLGRAQMAAFAGNGYVQSGARSSLLAAIRTGLDCSRNLGCSFNTQAMWNSLQVDRARTSNDFGALVDPIRTVAVNASLAPGDGVPLSPSSSGTVTPPPPPPPPSGGLAGTWLMGDDAVVVFRQSGNGYVGTMHNVTSLFQSLGYREGMEYFRFSQGSGNTFQGHVNIRSSDGVFNWKPCRVTVQGDNATFSDLFDGGRLSYPAKRQR